MYRLILFDLDGTVSDPKIGICTCVQYALEKMGIKEPDLDKLEPFIGPPLFDSFTEFYGMSEEEANRAIAYYRERFSVTGLYENELYPGMEELLAELKKAGRIVAIASSKPAVYVERILEYFQIRQYFDVVAGPELGGRSTKEDVINQALDLLRKQTGLYKADSVMVGDRKFDVEAANRLGVASVGVSYGYGPVEELTAAGAKIIAGSVAELRKILLAE